MVSPDRTLSSALAEAPAGNILVIGSGEIDFQKAYTELWMPDGQVVRVPTTVLQSPVAPDAPTQGAPSPSGASSETLQASGGETIPLVEERLLVTKRTVTTGKVRLVKSEQTYQETLNEPLAIRTFDVDRVMLNQVVEEVPPVRQEGDTTVYPVVEERMILTKQLVLREEVHVTRRDTQKLDTQVVTLRREHLTVEREAVKLEQS